MEEYKKDKMTVFELNIKEQIIANHEKKILKLEREIKKLNLILKTPRLYVMHCKENNYKYYGSGIIDNSPTGAESPSR